MRELENIRMCLWWQTFLEKKVPELNCKKKMESKEDKQARQNMKLWKIVLLFLFRWKCYCAVW